MTIGDTFDKIWHHQLALMAPEYYEEETMPLTEITLDNVEDVFSYHAPNPDQINRMQQVRDDLIAAAKTILTIVPRCPMRTQALNALVEARMKANAAIMLEHLS